MARFALLASFQGFGRWHAADSLLFSLFMIQSLTGCGQANCGHSPLMCNTCGHQSSGVSWKTKDREPLVQNVIHCFIPSHIFCKLLTHLEKGHQKTFIWIYNISCMNCIQHTNSTKTRVTLMEQIQQLQVANSAIRSVEANQSVDSAHNTSQPI